MTRDMFFRIAVLTLIVMCIVGYKFVRMSNKINKLKNENFALKNNMKSLPKV
jgi:hypothetical protein